MPVVGDDDEAPPFRPLTPEQQAAIEERVRKAKERAKQKAAK